MSRGPRWSAAELAILVELRELRRRPWPEIAMALPGRSPGACCLAWYGVLARRGIGTAARAPAADKAAKMVRALPRHPIVPAAVPDRTAPDAAGLPPRRFGVVTLAVLAADAELRARVAAQGPTAGLLGDPVPGRSALDRRRLGIEPDPAPADGRTWRMASKITLAGQS